MPVSGYWPENADGEPALSPGAAERARSRIGERIRDGRAILKQLGGKNRAALDLYRDYERWSTFNRQWLSRKLGPVAVRLYGYRSQGLLFQFMSAQIAAQVSDEIRGLEKVADRLELWTHDLGETSDRGLVSEGAVFIVHGRNMDRAEEVKALIESMTDREGYILRDLPNQGRTILEKFEDYAASTAFAVVLLTADDEGRLRGDGEMRFRGRQNVIFELGFFYGKLGRRRVAVLVDAGVEHPSDVAGLAYTMIDEAGAWRTELGRELAAAGIAVAEKSIGG